MEPATIAARNAREANESEIIRRAIAGDAAALHALFSQHSRRLYFTALRVVGSPEEAEEVLQEAMLNAFRNLYRFEGRSQFSTWLTRIVINAAIMRLRGRKEWRDVSLDAALSDGAPLAEQLPHGGPNPEQLYAREELRAKIERSVEQLSPVLRSAFLLREVQGLSTKNAAELLKVPIGTVKARLHRAKNQLRCALSRPRVVLSRHRRAPALRPGVSPCASD